MYPSNGIFCDVYDNQSICTKSIHCIYCSWIRSGTCTRSVLKVIGLFLPDEWAVKRRPSVSGSAKGDVGDAEKICSWLSAVEVNKLVVLWTPAKTFHLGHHGAFTGAAIHDHSLTLGRALCEADAEWVFLVRPKVQAAGLRMTIPFLATPPVNTNEKKYFVFFCSTWRYLPRHMVTALSQPLYRKNHCSLETVQQAGRNELKSIPVQAFL